jgi:NAD(P)-dependent dehydrogenase (short-subunit alcohol dehydrogenase family)
MIGKPQVHVEDKVAIVTGGSRGIGEAIARSLARHGAKVVVASRKADGLEAVAAAIRAEGGEAVAVTAHMGYPEQVDALVARALDAFGRVDVLVNNAATNPYFGPMMNLDWGAWDKTFDVNVKGYFAATRAVVRHLLDRGAPGSIINVASVVGLRGSPLQGIYGMTKAAVISMTRTLAMELGGARIRVNAIAPGLVDTKFAAALTTDDEVRARVMQRTALGRIGTPEDISGAALYLASDASSFMTGHVLTVDAGWTVGL